MVRGAEDYWATSSRLMATLLEAITSSVSAGGTLINALDSIDGKVDGFLTVSELTTVQADLLAELTGINVSLATGGDVVAALDSLDGKADGFITLADLNSGQCEMLAKLLGIETSVETGGNLIAKLDALDGTMDGKLTLAQLNSSSVKTNLDTVIIRLNTQITSLGTQITRLTNMLASDVMREEYQKAAYPGDWFVVGDAEELIANWNDDRRYWKALADINNAHAIKITEREADETYITSENITAGNFIEKHYNTSKIYAECLTVGQTAGFMWTEY